MGDFIDLSLNCAPFLLLFVGYMAGRRAESAHYKSIHRREEGFAHIPVTTTKKYSEERPVTESRMAVGSVVVSIDYYKRFLAHVRNLFGGEVAAYSPLLDRGRREAILRMKESCPDAHMFVNMRLETATLFNGNQKSIGSVEMMCYATALKFSA